MKGLDGKVALLVGGGEGAGRSIALGLAARGVRIVVTGPDERALGETVGEIAYGGGKARHLAGDVRDAAHLDAAALRAIEVFGSLDFVIANVEVHDRVDLGGYRARAETILSTNLVGTYNAFDAAARHVKGPGRVIATSSVLEPAGATGHGAFRASRAGIVGLVQAAAVELAPRKVTCNAVLPGWVDSDASERRFGQIAAAHGQKTKDELKTEAAATSPLGRFVQPEEVADVVLFLCSSAGEAITGQTLAIGARAPLTVG